MSADAPTIDPTRLALVLMDYQPAVMSRVPDAEPALAKAGDALRVARANGVLTAHVRVAFDDDDYATVPEQNAMFSPVAQHRMLHHEAPETQFDPSVSPEDGDLVVRKTRVGAFSTTDLAEQLAARGVSAVILAGISTSGVVLSTVRDAADRDLGIYVLADACADPDPAVHEALTQKVFTAQARVIRVADLARLVGAPQA
jgi:nicotinamidase-related amidase